MGQKRTAFAYQRSSYLVIKQWVPKDQGGIISLRALVGCLALSWLHWYPRCQPDCHLLWRQDRDHIRPVFQLPGECDFLGSHVHSGRPGFLQLIQSSWKYAVLSTRIENPVHRRLCLLRPLRLEARAASIEGKKHSTMIAVWTKELFLPLQLRFDTRLCNKWMIPSYVFRRW